jgi:hypothetical protein
MNAKSLVLKSLPLLAVLALALPAFAINPQQKVMLGCKNPGSHQDVAKTPSVINTNSTTLAKGKWIYWSATDGDQGSLKLEADLLPNKSVKVLGSPGNGYSCSAWYYVPVVGTTTHP